MAALCLFICGLFICATAQSAHAHHNTGHGASESIRSINALGTDPKPRQRLALLEEVAQGTDEPDLNVALGYSTSLLLQTHLGAGFYLSAQLPFLLIDQSGGAPLLAGLGDARFGAQWNLQAKQKASPWTLLFSMSVPTRTYRLQSDPGRQWLFSPGVSYSQSFGKLSLYGLFLASYEERPAGGALDLSPGAGVGLQLLPPLTLTFGGSLDIRALNRCRLPDGTQSCPAGRPSEQEREIGATRGYLTLALSYELHEDWTLFGSGQLPVTTKKDIEWGANLGIEWRFEFKGRGSQAPR